MKALFIFHSGQVGKIRHISHLLNLQMDFVSQRASCGTKRDAINFPALLL